MVAPKKKMHPHTQKKKERIYERPKKPGIVRLSKLHVACVGKRYGHAPSGGFCHLRCCRYRATRVLRYEYRRENLKSPEIDQSSVGTTSFDIPKADRRCELRCVDIQMLTHLDTENGSQETTTKCAFDASKARRSPSPPKRHAHKQSQKGVITPRALLIMSPKYEKGIDTSP